jgi:hypothetical protein
MTKTRLAVAPRYSEEVLNLRYRRHIIRILWSPRDGKYYFRFLGQAQLPGNPVLVDAISDALKALDAELDFRGEE